MQPGHLNAGADLPTLLNTAQGYASWSPKQLKDDVSVPFRCKLPSDENVNRTTPPKLVQPKLQQSTLQSSQRPLSAFSRASASTNTSADLTTTNPQLVPAPLSVNATLAHVRPFSAVHTKRNAAFGLRPLSAQSQFGTRSDRTTTLPQREQQREQAVKAEAIVEPQTESASTDETRSSGPDKVPKLAPEPPSHQEPALPIFANDTAPALITKVRPKTAHPRVFGDTSRETIPERSRPQNHRMVTYVQAKVPQDCAQILGYLDVQASKDEGFIPAERSEAVAVLNRLVTELRQEGHVNKLRVTQLTNELQELKASTEALRKNAAAEQRYKEQLQATILELKAEIEDYKMQIHQLRGEARDRNQLIEELHEKISMLERQLTAEEKKFETAFVRHQQEVRDLRMQYDVLQGAYNELEQVFNDERKNNLSNQTLIDETVRTHKVSERKHELQIAQLQEELRREQHNAAIVEKVQKLRQAEHDATLQTLAKVSKELEDLKDRFAALQNEEKAQREAHQAKEAKLEDKIATLEQALQDAQSSIRTLRANVVERSEELRKTKIALDATKDLEAKVEELTTMVSVREEAIRALEAEKAELVETLTSVRKSAREDSKRLAELLATEEQLESKVSMYTQGMRDLMAKYSSKRTAYEAEIAELKSQLQSVREQYEACEARLRREEEKSTDFRQQRNLAEKKILALQEEIQKLEEVCMKKARQQAAAEMECSIQEMKSEIKNLMQREEHWANESRRLRALVNEQRAEIERLEAVRSNDITAALSTSATGASPEATVSSGPASSSSMSNEIISEGAAWTNLIQVLRRRISELPLPILNDPEARRDEGESSVHQEELFKQHLRTLELLLAGCHAEERLEIAQAKWASREKELRAQIALLSQRLRSSRDITVTPEELQLHAELCKDGQVTSLSAGTWVAQIFQRLTEAQSRSWKLEDEKNALAHELELMRSRVLFLERNFRRSSTAE